MTREIKFRVWDGKKMHYPTVIEVGINNVNGLTSASFPLSSGGYCTSSFVMQYSELQDKHDRDIYAGDIIKLAECGNLKSGESIITIAKLFGWQAIFETPYNNVSWECAMGATAQNYREIIGNIYETPELLK